MEIIWNLERVKHETRSGGESCNQTSYYSQTDRFDLPESWSKECEPLYDSEDIGLLYLRKEDFKVSLFKNAHVIGPYSEKIDIIWGDFASIILPVSDALVLVCQ